MAGRSPEMIRREVEQTRRELAFSVNDLRSKVTELTNWRGQLVRNRKAALIGAAVAGFAVVTALLFLLAALAAFIAYRLFKKGAPPTPDMAIEEAKRTRAELEAQKIERDQVQRSLERGGEVKA